MLAVFDVLCRPKGVGQGSSGRLGEKDKGRHRLDERRLRKRKRGKEKQKGKVKGKPRRDGTSEWRAGKGEWHNTEGRVREKV